MLQIFETKPNTYKVPAIDSRNRKGCAMFQIVTSKLGTPSTAEMITFDGKRVAVKFSATGWMIEEMPVFTILHKKCEGVEPFAEFSFHAIDEADAARKAFGWERYHSLTRNSVTVRPATNHEATHWIHDEWVN